MAKKEQSTPTALKFIYARAAKQEQEHLNNREGDSAETLNLTNLKQF